MTRRLRVACAVMAENGRLFAARRGPGGRNGGLWELPGGKLEPGETPSACLERELKEELGVDVRADGEWDAVRHDEPGFSLELIPVLCSRVKGEPTAGEHAESGWFDPAGLKALEWSPADVPVVERWLKEQARPL
jgi:8-oxo-dGTP diphosphatase